MNHTTGESIEAAVQLQRWHYTLTCVLWGTASKKKHPDDGEKAGKPASKGKVRVIDILYMLAYPIFPFY